MCKSPFGVWWSQFWPRKIRTEASMVFVRAAHGLGAHVAHQTVLCVEQFVRAASSGGFAEDCKSCSAEGSDAHGKGAEPRAPATSNLSFPRVACSATQ